MTSTKFLTIAFTLALVATVSAFPAAADRSDVFTQETRADDLYESPPFWQEETYNDEDLPINYRRGGARGGWDRTRRRSISKRFVVFDKDGLSLNGEFDVVNIKPEASAVVKKRVIVKRAFEYEQEEQEEQGLMDYEDEGEEEDEEDDYGVVAISEIEEGFGNDYDVNPEEEEDEEEEEEEEEGEEEEDDDDSDDDDEEASDLEYSDDDNVVYISEDSLEGNPEYQDWIRGLRFEGQEQEEEEEDVEQEHEQEPEWQEQEWDPSNNEESSEENIFAASWSN
ncbi:hypothetical protein BGZ80_009351 [Entomortierella chlamydospora]|uniref:Uncharacterized protein n=1 Tax=Entomortierella chlamydospora TaxID=101097 RepID=A0A9P6T158_9FUNG|nr:hypothetical protein BGZ79_002267 [Entomortierella chlamydospora]KAG0016228.1 hypothetical protein BGZ80_009351 [Entomortierella chlamydospora]